MRDPEGFSSTISLDFNARLSAAHAASVMVSVESIKKANQARAAEDTVIEFRQTPSGQSGEVFVPKP